MKFSLSWLKDHLETTATLDELSDALTMLGLEVEEIHDPAKALGAFTVAKIISTEQHPNADKLKLCKVATAKGEMQVVCGAPNAREGLTGIFAPEGAYVPGIDMTLKPTEIRGVQSNGMMCSERELELSEEHNGIIDLEGDFEVGMSAADALGVNDPVIEIAITPNRPDCTGVRGIARDLAAMGVGTLKAETIETVPGTFESNTKVDLKFDGDPACQLFLGRMIKGVKNGPSPDWLQKKLRAIGLRPINALVDITNYMSFDRARPLHVFDADKLSGTVHARMGRTGEEFLALDGKEYKADDSMCVIADDNGMLGLGGVMGGEASGCTEDTVNVFVECALFDPITIATAGRKTGITSDARFRFERGVDPEFAHDGMEMATRLILDMCGGEASTVESAGAIPEWRREIAFDTARVRKLTGLELDDARIFSILEALGFESDSTSSPAKVTPPSWRPDVHGSADLVEEAVRVHGINEVKPTPLPRLHAVAKPILTPMQGRVRLARRGLASRGLSEAVTWAFCSKQQAELFGGGQKALELANPISSELSDMRPSILATLAAAAQRNIDRGMRDVALFEVGAHYANETPEGQSTSAAGLRAGNTTREWQGASAPDVFTAKEDALAALAAAGGPAANAQVSTGASEWYHPGRSGLLTLGPKVVLAQFGELHPRVVEALGLSGRVAAFEVYLDAIPAPRKKATRSKPPLDAADLMPVRRDFAFVVTKDVAGNALLKAARAADKKLITDAQVFDIYEGKGIDADSKSVAIEVTLQPTGQTMTDKDIDAVSEKIVASVQKATGGTLRG
ncbi:phenylalanine--tRNA ligase subunit beta [Pyruvatibacter sp.]|nr:phenylalanine--tRNA ligase subunit beta [Alphaproteobacteria bacterium]